MSLMTDTAETPIPHGERERWARLGELVSLGARALREQGKADESAELLAIAYYECLIGD